MEIRGNPQKVSQHAGLRSLAGARRPKNRNNNGSWLLIHFGEVGSSLCR